MKRWFQELMYKMNRAMDGTYGHDALGTVLIVTSMILVVCGTIPGMQFLSVLALPIMIWSAFRCFSKNIPARQKELDTYLRFIDKRKKNFKLYRHIWQERKTHCYFKCKNCGAILRVPKHKGKIEVSCPKCGNKTMKKT